MSKKSSIKNNFHLAEATALSVDKSIRTLSGADPADVDGHNASRDVHDKFTKMGYSLPLQIHETQHDMETPDHQTLTTYHVKPLDWMEHWMTNAPELLGGSGNVFANFKSFWRVYQVTNPEHLVFEHHQQHLERVIPLLVHGDEGRAVKRTNYLVMSVESPIGSQYDPTMRCECHGKLVNRSGIPDYGTDLGTLSGELLESARKQFTNFKGHSYLSRWLLFGVGGWIYKKHPMVVDQLLQMTADSLKELFHDGFDLHGMRIFGAVIAVKGDLDFHKKTFNLTRSYANVGEKKQIPMCHSCLGGTPGIDFEDFAEEPVWETSMNVERPWPLDDPPILSQIPFSDNAPERILQWDMFHLFRLGVGRDIIGGILIMLLRLGFMDYEGSTVNLPDRFKRAHSMFALWAAVHHEHPGLRSFTKAFFNMKCLISAPWASSKGSDTILLLKWLRHFVKLNVEIPTVAGHERLLKEMLQVLDASLDLGMIHGHKLFLERACARRLYVSIMTVCRGYARLGQRALAAKIRAFVLKPKIHGMHHVAKQLQHELKKGATLIPNPAVYSCDVNEDFLGRISRLSRRVGFKLCDLRVIHRYFFKIVALLKRRRRLKGRPLRKHLLKAAKWKLTLGAPQV